MLKIRNYISLCLLCCITLGVHAQKTTVRATVEPSDILIGQQAIITLEAIAPKGTLISFPVYQDTLTKGIEVLRMMPVDTTLTEIMTLRQRYIVTSFDSTLYHIPYMQILDGKDTLKTNGLGLKVSAPILSDSTLAYLELLKNQQTDSIDFEELQLADIKDIQSPPFVWTDYLEYIYIPMLIIFTLCIIGIGLYLLLRKKKKGYYFKPEVILPPHTIALQQLDKLKARKLGQQGMEKEFYTELTDIVRLYIDKRFGINAPEMITEDIVEAIAQTVDESSTVANLKQMLTLADLAKFAKYTPFADENDLSLVNAYLFVNQTKIEEQPKPEDGAAEQVDNTKANS